MNKHAVYHVLDVPYAYGKDRDTLVLRLRVARDDIKECSVLYRCRYDWENEYKRKKMKLNYLLTMRWNYLYIEIGTDTILN